MSAYEFRQAVKAAIVTKLEGDGRDMADGGVMGLRNQICGKPILLTHDQYLYFTGQLHGLEHALDLMDDVYAQMHATETTDPFNQP